MFTELFHTTTISSFKNIKNSKKILCREQTNKEPQSSAMPSNQKLVYFSCSELHNNQYIIAKNVIPEDILIDFKEVDFNLIQIKILADSKQITNLGIKIVNDEDSFFKPVLNSLKLINNQYNLEDFIIRDESDEKMQEILNFLPHKTFNLGSEEYEQNRDSLLLPSDPQLRTLLSNYYVTKRVETCALENELDLEKLKLDGIKCMYREMKVTSKNIRISEKHSNSSETKFSITQTEPWENII